MTTRKPRLTLTHATMICDEAYGIGVTPRTPRIVKQERIEKVTLTVAGSFTEWSLCHMTVWSMPMSQWHYDMTPWDRLATVVRTSLGPPSRSSALDCDFPTGKNSSTTYGTHNLAFYHTCFVYWQMFTLLILGKEMKSISIKTHEQVTYLASWNNMKNRMNLNHNNLHSRCHHDLLCPLQSCEGRGPSMHEVLSFSALGCW